MEAVDAYKSGGGASVTFRDEENRLYADVALAAVLVVAQARVEVLREHHVHVWSTGSGRPHCLHCPVAAAEALVARLEESMSKRGEG